MNLLDKLERKFGRFAIPNLIYYIVAMYGAGTILQFVAPGVYGTYLSLDAKAILEGQIWRLFTFLFAPVSNSIFWAVFMLMLYYFLGVNLERYWGSFRFNLYFFLGALMQVIAAIIIYLAFKKVYPLGIGYLNQSLFLAFVVLFPNVEFRLFFILPIKAKWIGILQGIGLLTIVILGVLSLVVPQLTMVYGLSFTISDSIAVVLALSNFLYFYLSTRQVRMAFKQSARRKKIRHEKSKVMPFNSGKRVARHQCHTCHRTDLTNPELEFRYCSKCEGNFEYCGDHLYTHIHVKNSEENL